jgi:hypothetical protein
MAWREKVRDELAAIGPITAGKHPLRCRQGDQQLSLDLVALDSLACAFDRLVLASGKLAGAPVDRLKRAAEELSAKINYLLEPVQPIEVDPLQCTVQLRSVPPQKDDDTTTYYELLVQRSGEISLARYQHVVGQGRTPTPAQVTREVLARLVEDFAAVAG